MSLQGYCTSIRIQWRLLSGVFFHKLPHDSGPLNESITIMTKRVVMPVLPSTGDHLSTPDAPWADRALPSLSSIHVSRPRLTWATLHPLGPLRDHLGLLVVVVAIRGDHCPMRAFSVGVCKVVRNVPVVQPVEVNDAYGAEGDVPKAKERSTCCWADRCQPVSPVKIVWKDSCFTWMQGNMRTCHRLTFQSGERCPSRHRRDLPPGELNAFGRMSPGLSQLRCTRYHRSRKSSHTSCEGHRNHRNHSSGCFQTSDFCPWEARRSRQVDQQSKNSSSFPTDGLCLHHPSQIQKQSGSRPQCPRQAPAV